MSHLVTKSTSLLMALVFLFSTMSFTINMHYCGDTLVEVDILHKAKGCGMEMEKPSTEGCSTTKKNCCDDKQLSIEGQDELHLPIHKISFEQKVFISSFGFTYINLFDGLEKNISFYEKYKPPLIIRYIYKIDETYLI